MGNGPCSGGMANSKANTKRKMPLISFWYFLQVELCPLNGFNGFRVSSPKIDRRSAARATFRLVRQEVVRNFYQTLSVFEHARQAQPVRGRKMEAFFYHDLVRYKGRGGGGFYGGIPPYNALGAKGLNTAGTVSQLLPL